MYNDRFTDLDSNSLVFKSNLFHEVKSAVMGLQYTMETTPAWYNKKVWEDRSRHLSFIRSVLRNNNLTEYDIFTVIKHQYCNGKRGIIGSRYNRYLNNLGRILADVDTFTNTTDKYHSILKEADYSYRNIQKKITKAPSLVEENQKLEEELSQLTKENAKLTKKSEPLDTEYKELYNKCYSSYDTRIELEQKNKKNVLEAKVKEYRTKKDELKEKTKVLRKENTKIYEGISSQKPAFNRRF